MRLRTVLGLGLVVAALWPRPAGRGSTRRPPRPDRDEAGEPVDAPRHPTLSGGAAASLDA